jgi:integrase
MSRPKRPALKRRLTGLFIRNLKPEDGPLIWDTVQRGLAVRVRPSSHKSFWVVYSRRGRARWLLLGGTDVVPLADARTMAAEAMLAVAKGGDPAAERKAERGAGTFAEIHDRYLEDYAKKHNKSWRQADALIRRNVLPRWGKLQASTITRSDVKAMMARIEAPIVANQVLAACSAVFTWGVAEELVGSNPCRSIPRNATRSRERVLSDTELPLFWNAFDEIDPVLAAALRMILISGQRPGEVTHMRREHVKDGWWEMPGEPVAYWPGTKNGESHRVWLSRPALEILAQLRILRGTLTGFVFANQRRGPIRKLDAAMRKVSAKLGVEPVTPHDLRRTFSTTVTGLGFGRDALNRVTNHREGGIASVYDRHGYADENKRIMETVARKIMELVEGRARDNVVQITR